MIEFRWKITDDLARVSLEEYDRERAGYVDGWLEIAVGQEKLGFYPDENMWPDGTEGLEAMEENLLYWFHSLLKGLHTVKIGERYIMLLINQNLCDLVMVPFEDGEHVEVSLVRRKSQVKEAAGLKEEVQWTERWLEEEMQWTEKVTLEELEREICSNIKGFLDAIEDVNPQLLRAARIKDLREDFGRDMIWKNQENGA